MIFLKKSETNFFKKIKSCEKIIARNGEYKSLLNEIIKEIKRLSLLISDDEFPAFIDKIREKMPKVYGFYKSQ